MGGFSRRTALVGLAAVSVLLALGVGGARATLGQHGIAFVKGCDSPTNIGDPYNCSYTILNVVDTVHDTLKVTGLSDQVHAAGGDVNSGNVLPALQLIFSGAVTCVGGSGAGTVGSPYIGATQCTMPFGSSISTNSHSFYTVQAADFGLPGHQLTDTATLNWFDTCDIGAAPPSNCTTGAQTASAGSSTLVDQLSSSTATDIHNAAHAVVTTVPVGTTVHDFVTVTGQPGSPFPTGNVTIDWFLNGDCSGAPAANSGPIALGASGTVDATGFNFTVNSAGHRAFRAHYLGDATYTPSDGACEPLTVVDANIQLTPPTATNQIGTNHVLTCHINVNDGNGFVNAPAGTQCTVSIIAGPGGPASQNCLTVGATGDCQVTISSNVTGTTTIRASTDVSVAGVTLHRETGDAHAGDSADAQKLWVNAAIVIAPNATNEVGQPHTFTVTVLQDTGSGLVPVGAGLPCNVTLTNGNGAVAVPAGPFNLSTNASGQCQVTFTSQTGGTVTGNASSTVTINGVVMNVSTNGTAPNSGPAVKTFVDANIQITPQNATNPVGSNHTLFGHVNINDGSGGFTNAPAGTTIQFSLTNQNGASATFVGPSSCTTIGATGTCSVVISSPTAGNTIIKATTDVVVGGVSLHRETGDSHPGDGPNANKAWASARISIAPNATNEINAPHTFTVTLEKDTGGGFVPAAGEHVTVTLTDGNGASHTAPTGTCTNAGANTNASGQCTITFTSPTPGTVTGHASATIDFGGGTIITVQTNGLNGNSVDAAKTFVDANIQLTPGTATNPVGTNHTLHCHVNVNAGGGAGYVNAPAGTVCTVNIISGPGTPATQNCSTVGATGTCDVVITSSTPGTSTIQATTTVSVGGVSLTRTTGDAHVGDGPNATKLWADDTVRTDIHDAAHNVITQANGGDVVHDKVFVAKAAGTPASVPDPTGNVTFRTFTGLACTGGATSSETVALAADGTAESSTTTVTGDMSYQAEYSGDANYPTHTGACEPLQVKTTLPCPAGSFTFHMEANGDLTIVYDQFPAPNDNSYGANAVGWGSKGHTFGNLVGSDHAGFSLIDPSNVTKLDFNIDYISQVAGTPSGYASLGPFGGDGKVNVGTLAPGDVTFDSSLARNLNNTGYFSGGIQVVGNAVANLLVDSPPTLNTTDSYTLTPTAAAVFTAPNFDSADTQGWNFHDTYFVTIKAAKLAALGFNPSTWKVAPNADELHNSPAKPCPCVDQQDPNPTLDAHDNGNGTTTFTFTQSLAVNDNSYGTGTDASWAGKGHKFSDLTGSDKAEFVITNGNGQSVLDVFVDYLSAKAGAPSGYGSLGPFGGDGSVVSGDTSKIVSFDTSIDDDLNVLCPPPAGPWTTNSPTSPGKPECAAWNFTNSYKLTVNNSLFGASGLGTFSVPAVHNSPSKPLTCPGAKTAQLSVTKKEVKDKQVKITIKNTGTADAFLTALALSWPQATNGNLVQIKLDGDVLYNNATGVSSPASLGVPPLVADQNKRKIGHGSSDVLTLIFKNNASTNLALYTGTASFGPTDLTILP